MNGDTRYYARPELARHLLLSLRGEVPFGDGPDGVFLAAPRRTGKTTFLRQELVPALENSGATVVYVDLWAEETRDPAALIRQAIGEALVESAGKAQGALPKAARKLGLNAVGLNGWLEFDTSGLGTADGATLSSALQALHEMTGTPVALIVDEAQQALVTKDGENTLRALKAARDAMNSPDTIHLMLVMTGSDRDKLLRLTNTNTSAFLGSEVRTMPTLGRAYIEAVASDIESSYPQLGDVGRDALDEAFTAFGHRPQPFAAAVGEALNPLVSTDPHGFEAGVLERAGVRLAADREQMSDDYLALEPLARAVLWRLLEQRERFRPYDAAAIAFYRERLAESGATRKLDAQSVQTALRKLRQGTPSLVWKSARGEYAPEDSGMHGWYDELNRTGAWPPGRNA